jgi:N-acetylmuramoyl-L-alanine amidase
MNRLIIIIFLAAATLAGCSTSRKAQRTTVTDTDVPARENRTVTPQVVELDLTGLFPSDFSGRKVIVNNGALDLTTDSAGKITFVMPESDTILLTLSPCPDPHSGCNVAIPVSGWFVPYKYAVKPDGSVERKTPWVEFRRTPEAITYQPQFDFLCKSEYPATVSINWTELKQYKTGIFIGTVKFKEGVNRVRAEATYPDGRTAFCEQEFIYEKRDLAHKTFPLWIEARSVEPANELVLLPGDVFRVSFRGSLGQEAIAEVTPGKMSVKCSRQDFTDYSLYSADLPLNDLVAGKTYMLNLKLIPIAGAADKKVFEYPVKGTIRVMDPEDFPLVKVRNENSRLTYNLGAPRLGGPIRSELGPGVVMKSSGKMGKNYRIRLSATETGYINEDDVEVMPAGTVRPFYYITSMSCGPAKDADVLTIPYPEPVAYEVYPDPDGKRIVITLFGVETSSTWITHRTGRKIIDKVTWEQTAPGTYKIYVNLNTDKIWGYDLRPDGKSLVLRIKYPPEYDLENEKPLTGLKIAIEAGHGGSGMGAIGLSGLVEKDINLDLSFRLGDLLKSMGAEVIQARDSDKDMLLIEKRDIAISSGADMLISIHANAGGRGYLSTGGTSTYWHNPFWAPLAESIYARLLETGLPEFGVVGSFNYTVTRTSQMPAILVEQAFMTNAEDEEKLADPLFRQLMAEKICEGITDYLRQMSH